MPNTDATYVMRAQDDIDWLQAAPRSMASTYVMVAQDDITWVPGTTELETRIPAVADIAFYEQNIQLPDGTVKRAASAAEIAFQEANAWLPTGTDAVALLAPEYQPQGSVSS